MKQVTSHKTVWFIFLLVLLMLSTKVSTQAFAEEAKPDAEVKAEDAVEAKAEAVVEAEAPRRLGRSRRGGLYGDWRVKIDYGERQS